MILINIINIHIEYLQLLFVCQKNYQTFLLLVGFEDSESEKLRILLHYIQVWLKDTSRIFIHSKKASLWKSRIFLFKGSK